MGAGRDKSRLKHASSICRFKPKNPIAFLATPHVAGVAALVWSHFPECSNHQIRNVLLKTALDQTGGGGESCDVYYGFGIVQAKAAYDLILAEGCDGAGGNDPPVPSDRSPGGCLQLDQDDGVPAPTPPQSNCFLFQSIGFIKPHLPVYRPKLPLLKKLRSSEWAEILIQCLFDQNISGYFYPWGGGSHYSL